MIIGIVMPHCLPEHRGGGIASAAARLARHEPLWLQGKSSFTSCADRARRGNTAKRRSREHRRLRAVRFNLPQAVSNALREQDFPARLVGLLSARLPRTPTPRRRRAGFAEKRWGTRSNRKLRFNIRSRTEDEINGTVKGDV
ncbi:hypothetical protein [Bradyrhizobium sp. CCBAU 25338]|uniref:hypothetical protein n=1 Tax=Bradyrhizobium sp. CCBAU 25338 TaxID=1641877 RepID=UPI002302ED2F|nr:hypothetical protein [Bradyrhizobium sp. CCBAU 25338]